jgi:hypothetical protein
MSSYLSFLYDYQRRLEENKRDTQDRVLVIDRNGRVDSSINARSNSPSRRSNSSGSRPNRLRANRVSPPFMWRTSNLANRRGRVNTDEGSLLDFFCGFLLGFLCPFFMLILVIVMCRLKKMVKGGLMVGFVAQMFFKINYMTNNAS